MNTLLLALTLLAPLSPSADAFQVKVTGHGRPMILIPGLAAGGDTWDATVDRFKDRFECHVLTVAGFAGVPRSAAMPMLDHVVDGLAAYIRDTHLQKPVIVGHSLGGFLALKLAIQYPDLPGAIVDVDGYVDYLRLTGAATSRDQATAIAAQIRRGVGQSTQEGYEAYVRAGTSTRTMVTRDADFQILVRWGLASDRTAVADAMGEMYGADLRADLAKITAPTLVLAAWKAYEQYTDHDRHMAALRDQFGALAGVRLALNDTSRHFIMWDDPQWMFAQIEAFLGGL